MTSTNDMSPEARELELYVMNTERIYRRYYLPAARSLERKQANGVFDRDLAVQQFMHVASSSARAYHHEHGTPGFAWHRMFTPLCRREVAESLTDAFIDETSVEPGKFIY